PDGKQIAFLSVPRKGTHRDAFNLAVLTLGEAGTPVRLVGADHHGPSKSSHLAPLYSLPDDCWAGLELLYYLGEDGALNRHVKIDLTTRDGSTDGSKKEPAKSLPDRLR